MMTPEGKVLRDYIQLACLLGRDDLPEEVAWG